MYEDFKEEIEILEAKLKDHTSKATTVFYGSSSFRLWDSLAQDLKGLDTLNLAFGGSNLGACAFYFERLFRNVKPQRVVLYCGDNDIVDGFDPLKVVQDFKDVFQKLKNRFGDVPFVFVSIKPSPIKAHLLSDIQEVNRNIESLVKTLSNTSYLDVHTSMLDENGLVRKELYAEDKLHLNAIGYQLWKSLFRSYLSLD